MLTCLLLPIRTGARTNRPGHQRINAAWAGQPGTLVRSYGMTHSSNTSSADEIEYMVTQAIDPADCSAASPKDPHVLAWYHFAPNQRFATVSRSWYD